LGVHARPSPTKLRGTLEAGKMIPSDPATEIWMTSFIHSVPETTHAIENGAMVGSQRAVRRGLGLEHRAESDARLCVLFLRKGRLVTGHPLGCYPPERRRAN